MKILLTGGTGFLGTALVKSFLSKDYEITLVSHNLEKFHKQFAEKVNVVEHLNDINADDYFDIIINLAGAPIFGALWTDKRKAIIRDSRINLTANLVDKMAELKIKPKLLISGSAIGFYGEQGSNIVTEDTSATHDFSQELCADWENNANKAIKIGVRVCLIRTGLVLGPQGGFLQRMLLPFKMGLGGTLGTGNQWMSWIHIKDWIAIVNRMILDDDMQGAYNATAPNPVTNKEFTKVFASCLNRPALLPLPSIFLKLLLGEMSLLLLSSQRVLPNKLEMLKFKFEYSDLSLALKDVVHNSHE